MSHYETDKRRASIRTLLQENKSRKQISEITGIPQSTVDRIIGEIHKDDKERWSDIANESIESRAILIKAKYELLAKECEDILMDKAKNPTARIDAGKTMIACHRNVYEMLKNGPLRFTQVMQMEDKSDEG